jgi:hypothetical protein
VIARRAFGAQGSTDLPAAARTQISRLLSF